MRRLFGGPKTRYRKGDVVQLRTSMPSAGLEAGAAGVVRRATPGAPAVSYGAFDAIPGTPTSYEIDFLDGRGAVLSRLTLDEEYLEEPNNRKEEAVKAVAPPPRKEETLELAPHAEAVESTPPPPLREEEASAAHETASREPMPAGMNVLAKIDALGSILEINKGMEIATGLPASSLVGMDVFSYFRNPRQVREWFDQSASGNPVRDSYTEILHRNGGSTSVRFSALAHKDGQGEITGGVLLMRPLD